MGETSFFYQLGAWNWLILAALLFVLELVVPGVFLMWFGVAAAVAGLAAFAFDIGWQWQFLLFAGASAAGLLFAKTFARTMVQSDRPLLNRRAQQLVGRSFVIEQSILNGRGKIRVGDSIWPVEGPDSPIGSRVKVTGTNGTVLVVEPDPFPEAELPQAGSF